MRKKRIGCFIPSTKDATSFWRAVGPIAHLEKYFDLPIEFRIMPSSFDWDDLAFLDGVFVQRPMSDNSKKMIELIHEMGLPLWLDYDDDLFDVPPGNPAYEIFSNPKASTRLEKIMAHARTISVSTEDLCVRYRKIHKGCKVIPNAWNLEEFGPKRRLDKIGLVNSKVITWRGSRTHDSDLMEFLDPLIEVLKERKDWKIIFVGNPLMYAVEKINRAIGDRSITLPPLPIYTFLHYLNHSPGGVGIVPLEDRPFNRAKSNIAWQEFTWGGASVLGPDFREWKVPGCTNYIDQSDFYEKLRWMTSLEPEERNKLNQTSWEHIQRFRNLRRANEERARMACELVGLEYGTEYNFQDIGEGNKEVS